MQTADKRHSRTHVQDVGDAQGFEQAVARGVVVAAQVQAAGDDLTGQGALLGQLLVGLGRVAAGRTGLPIFPLHSRSSVSELQIQQICCALVSTLHMMTSGCKGPPLGSCTLGLVVWPQVAQVSPFSYCTTA